MNHKFKTEGDILFVKSTGIRTSFTDVTEGARKVHDAIQESNCSKIFMDYSAVRFNLPTSEAFNLVRVFELKLQSFRNVKLSVYVNHSNYELGEFWASICKKRGFDYAVFTNYEDAVNYLKDD